MTKAKAKIDGRAGGRANRRIEWYISFTSFLVYLLGLPAFKMGFTYTHVLHIMKHSEKSRLKRLH